MLLCPYGKQLSSGNHVSFHWYIFLFFGIKVPIHVITRFGHFYSKYNVGFKQLDEKHAFFFSSCKWKHRFSRPLAPICKWRSSIHSPFNRFCGNYALSWRLLTKNFYSVSNFVQICPLFQFHWKHHHFHLIAGFLLGFTSDS